MREASEPLRGAHWEPACVRSFRLVKVEDGFRAPNGIWVRQKLLTCRATYWPPRHVESGDTHAVMGAKFTSLPQVLSYSDRSSYAAGTERTNNPVLSMADEFDRDLEWADWKGRTYNLRTEYAYCTGVATCMEGCTPGTRDMGPNDGMDVAAFKKRVNDHIQKRREAGYHGELPDKFAYLSDDEVIAVRLYSGASYQVLNGFLRSIASVRGASRRALVRHPELTFAATVGHIASAIRKLAAIATEEDVKTPLYRGVRGQLAPAFWAPDAVGMVAATDTAFMSTSRNMHTPIAYMDDAPGARNVLWQLQPQQQSDDAFHYGADISMLSQYAGEEEVLFPCGTLLQVLKSDEAYEKARKGKPPKNCTGLQAQIVEEHHRHFVEINVRPSFV